MYIPAFRLDLALPNRLTCQVGNLRYLLLLLVLSKQMPAG